MSVAFRRAGVDDYACFFHLLVSGGDVHDTIHAGLIRPPRFNFHRQIDIAADPLHARPGHFLDLMFERLHDLRIDRRPRDGDV